MNTNDAPLSVKVEDEQLVIRIGIETLAFAANASDSFKPYSEKDNDWVQKWRVTDALQFANDVRGELTDEAEDGSTILSDLLDEAIQNAADQGSTGIENVVEGEAIR